MEFTEYDKYCEDFLNNSRLNTSTNARAYICFSGKIGEDKWYIQLFHWLLKTVQKSWITHVCIVGKDFSGDFFCMESTKPVVQINDFKWFKLPYHQGEIYQLKEIHQNEHIDILKELSRKYLGKKYGYLQLIGILFVKLFSWLGFKKNIFGMDRNEQVCSELSDLYMRETIYSEMFKDIDPDLSTPKQLYDIIKELELQNKAKLVSTQGF